MTALQQFNDRPDERDFHGAALVTADGREVPITEEMVVRALDALEESLQRPLSSRAGA